MQNWSMWVKINAVFAFAMGVFALILLSQEQVVPALVVVGATVVIAIVVRLLLKPLDEVTRVLVALSQGQLDLPRLPESKDDEMGRLAAATNRLVSQLRGLAAQAGDLAEGRIGVLEVEDRVLQSGRLVDGDRPTSAARGDLETSFVELTNRMRRLTIQARVISRDHLYSPLLDDRVPGELGDAFALMVRNLRQLGDRAHDIAQGDLTTRVEGDGDLTTAFNEMVDGIKGLVEEITRTGLHISTSAEQILAVLREQELSASHQASGVEETQRTMETLLSSAKKIAESAQTVFKSAERTQANNRTVADRISELKSHTERIGEILEVIKSIADRSDLLALNASLEGMRAGEAGKGFTLVAAEMRRLAENIKASVGDIKELLSDIRASALSSVMATEEGSSLSERTTDSALKITLITQQQQSGTEQVTQSMDELSSLINHGVAGTRQVTTAASELAGMAEALRELVESFRVIAGNEAGSGRASGPGRSDSPRTQRPDRSPVRTLTGRPAEPKHSSEPRSGKQARKEEQREEKKEEKKPEKKREQKAGRAGSDTPVGLTVEALEGRRAHQTTPLSTGAGSDDPPTVQFSSGSDDERAILESMVRGRTKTDPGRGSFDAQLDALERDLSEASAPTEGGGGAKQEQEEDERG